MKQNLLIFVTILLINGVFGLPHGESCKFKFTRKKWFGYKNLTRAVEK